MMIVTICFVIEEVVHIVGYGLNYFYDWWNIMDIVIAYLGIVSLSMEDFAEVTLVRSLKLIRLLKLTHLFHSLRKLLSVIFVSLPDMINATIVVIINVFIFATIGEGLLGENYSDTSILSHQAEVRWNFHNFGGSVFAILMIVSGEWTDVLYKCIEGENTFYYKCHIFILCVFLIGNFILLNLFIVFLLKNFENINVQFSREDFSEANTVVDKDAVSNKSCSLIYRLVKSQFFEAVVTVIIISNCVTLCFDNASLQRHPSKFIEHLNAFYTGAFLLETLLRLCGLGCKEYFMDKWCRFDFAIISVSVLETCLNLAHIYSPLNIGGLKSFRALRPLRLIPRWQGMQRVVTALQMSLPAMCRTMIVCLFIWLNFAVVGVHLLSGRLFRCVTPGTDDVLSPEVIPFKEICLRENRSWEQPFVNFNHIGNSYLALFQLALFSNWSAVTETVVDIRGINDQPSMNSNPMGYIFIFSFIIVGCFFSMNLFIGVVVQSFYNMKKLVETGVVGLFLTDSQRQFYSAMKKGISQKPRHRIKMPEITILKMFYRLAKSTCLQSLVVVVIAFHVIIMAFDFDEITEHGISLTRISTYDAIYFGFYSFYTLEVVIKLLGFRQFYFHNGWNCLDFVLCIMNTLAIVIWSASGLHVDLSFTYCLRILHFIRYLNAIERAIDIRRLVVSFIASLPALINVSILLFLLLFIYAIMGTSFFASVKHNGAIDDSVNFENIPNSLLLLFQLSTSAGYEEILEALSISEPNCTPSTSEKKGNCGNKILAVLYLLSFILFAFIILSNILVAVILDSYNDVALEEKSAITDENIHDFYRCWQLYDPTATQYLNLKLLSDFLDELDDNIRIAKPNSSAIAIMDLPVSNSNQIHCVDILRGVFRLKFGEVDVSGDFAILQSDLEAKIKNAFPILKKAQMTTTTLEVRRQHFAARVIQRNYLKLKACSEFGFYATAARRNLNPNPNDVISEESIQVFYKQWQLFDPRATQYLPLDTLPDFLNALDEFLRIPKPNCSAIASMDVPLTKDEEIHCTNVLLGIAKVKGLSKKSENINREIQLKVKRLFPLFKIHTSDTITTME